MQAPLRALLETLGIARAEGTPTEGLFVTTSALVEGLPSDGPLVVLHDGKLQELDAVFWKREPPPFIWAAREPGQPPTEWEGRILAALLGGQSLRQLVVGEAIPLLGLDDLEQACNEVEEAVRASGAGGAPAVIAAEVLHELGCNALLDAPVDSNGVPRYAHRRAETRDVSPDDACEVRFVVAAGHAFLFAQDRFGRLPFAPLRDAAAGLGGKAKLNPEGGGAGLGLRRMLEASDLIAAQVVAGRSCGVLCGVDLGDSRRRRETPKSLFFSKVESR